MKRSGRELDETEGARSPLLARLKNQADERWTPTDPSSAACGVARNRGTVGYEGPRSPVVRGSRPAAPASKEKGAAPQAEIPTPHPSRNTDQGAFRRGESFSRAKEEGELKTDEIKFHPECRLRLFEDRCQMEPRLRCPKGGELDLNRLKPGEILVEGPRDADVQIALLIWVWGRKTNRATW